MSFDLLMTIPILFGNMVIVVVLLLYAPKDGPSFSNVFVAQLAVSDLLVGK